jgi:hypothetical protein
MSSDVEVAGKPPRRILSIDGGGILGTFPAAVLAELEQHLEYPIGSYFDLIAGTSTGGILAIGLAMGLKASTLLHLYETKGPAIFGQNHSPAINFTLRKVRSVRQLYRRKYGSEALKAALINVLGERRIGDAKTRLLVPAWSPVAQTVYLYKTAHEVRLRTDYKAPAVDAALATSAAPIYFRQHLSYRDVGLVDGGIWANNPIALAVTEAIGVLEWSAASLHILSLGCLEEVYSVPKGGGIGTLGRKVISLFMDGQSHGAMGMAKLLTGDVHKRKAIYRIDHHVPRGKYRMDDARGITDLKGLGHVKGRDQFPQLSEVFFRTPAEPFEPIYKLEPLQQEASTS